MRNLLTIGELSKISGVSASAIRYYEKEGLIVPSKKSDKGYRLYDFSELDRIESIALFRDLGLSLTTIKEHYKDYSYESNITLMEIAKHQVNERMISLRNIEKKIDTRMAKFKNHQLVEEKVERIQCPERNIRIFSQYSFDEVTIKESLELASTLGLSVDELFQNTYGIANSDGSVELGLAKNDINQIFGDKDIIIPAGDYLRVFMNIKLGETYQKDYLEKPLVAYAKEHHIGIDDIYIVKEDIENSFYAINILVLEIQVRILT